MTRLELSPHKASVLAAIAQTPKEYTQLHERLEKLLQDDEVALKIAGELISPSKESSPEVKKTAQGIRRWADRQKPRTRSFKQRSRS